MEGPLRLAHPRCALPFESGGPAVAAGMDGAWLPDREQVGWKQQDQQQGYQVVTDFST